MPLLRKTFFAPGTVRNAAGENRTFTREELGEYAQQTNQLLLAGYDVPLTLEHPKLFSEESDPMPWKTREGRADLMRNTVGRLRGIEQNPDGSVDHILDVPDPKLHADLLSGKIRYTSPEFRESWQDAEGRTWQNIISHFALTHQARNRAGQGPFQAVGTDGAATAGRLQCSMADLEPEDAVPAKPAPKKAPKQVTKTEKPRRAAPQQFGVGDDPEGAAAAEGTEEAAAVTEEGPAGTENENPDMPGDDTDPQLEALLARLSEMGLVLPADTTLETLVERLLTACATAAAIRKEAEATDDDDPQPGEMAGERITEDERPPMQYSLGDQKAPQLLQQAMKRSADVVNESILGLLKSGKIIPSVAKRIKAKSGTMQFSAAAEPLPQFTVPEILELFDEAMLPGAAYLADQFSAAQLEDTAKAEQEFLTDETDPRAKQQNLPTGDKAAEMARQQLDRTIPARKRAAAAAAAAGK